MPSRFRKITNSTLEGLAKRELNLSAIVGKSAEAKERRLVPEVIEDFFIQAAPIWPGPSQGDQRRPRSHVYRLGKIPRTLAAHRRAAGAAFGKLGREYQQIVFDKAAATKDATSEWVTPGHPLFEAVREDVSRPGSRRPAAGRRVLRPAQQGALAGSTCSRPRSRTAGATACTASCSSSRRAWTAA